MKRDMELVRKVLFAIEERPTTVADTLSIDGYSMEEVAYHCNLLYDAGLVRAYRARYASDEIYAFGVGSLTWDGQEYLERIRSEGVWNKIKQTILGKGLPMTIDVIKTIATEIALQVVKSALTGGDS